MEDNTEMKKWFWVAPALAVVSCQSQGERGPDAGTPAAEEETSGEPAEEETLEMSFDLNDADSLVGHSFDKLEPALEAAGIRYRVVERDGESFPVTRDYLPERLNFRIKDGVVTGVTKG